jgi:hypothetical protein
MAVSVASAVLAKSCRVRVHVMFTRMQTLVAESYACELV